MLLNRTGGVVWAHYQGKWEGGWALEIESFRALWALVYKLPMHLLCDIHPCT
jgi:hypothetical protein